jgi:hypothetical protein
MGREFGGGLKQVSREFGQLYGQRLEVRDIGLHVCAIVVELGIDPSSERRLAAYLDWIRLHWGYVSAVVGRGFQS